MTAPDSQGPAVTVVDTHNDSENWCPACSGRGWVYAVTDGFPRYGVVPPPQVPCPACSGGGR